MNVAFGELVEFAVGGGWGEDQPSDGMVPVRVMRGADFPAAESRDLASAPLRYEPSKKAASRILREGDIVLEVSGGTKDRPTGRSIFASPQLLSSVDDDVIPASFCRLVRINRTKASPAFVYYALQDLYNRGGTWEFQNQSTGIANFQFELFRERWRLDLPSLSEQQAIAEVLGALDDKIAANTALAATALELADKLFPPESGETSTRLADVVAVTKGNSYRSADLAPSDHALVTLKSITRDGRYAIEGLKQFTGQYRPQQVISPGEVVVAQTDLTQAAEVVGRAVRVPASDDYTLVASLDLAIVRPLRGIDQTYLLGLLRQPQFREHCRSNTTGTTVLHLRSGAIEEFAAQLADSEVQAVYARATLPLQQVADSAAAENRTLAATRDALLPQLMSGKLRVRDAEELIVQAGV